MDSYQVVLDFFEKAEEPVRTGDVVEATGLEKKEVEKAMNKLKKEEKIVSPKRCYWEMKNSFKGHI
ncbi:MAG: MarR family transcriptional regulator [Firmicutes bacterium]|nr:MarR family transcriptional regulator [Bacillota bacterium]